MLCFLHLSAQSHASLSQSSFDCVCEREGEFVLCVCVHTCTNYYTHKHTHTHYVRAGAKQIMEQSMSEKSSVGGSELSRLIELHCVTSARDSAEDDGMGAFGRAGAGETWSASVSSFSLSTRFGLFRAGASFHTRWSPVCLCLLCVGVWSVRLCACLSAFLPVHVHV